MNAAGGRPEGGQLISSVNIVGHPRGNVITSVYSRLQKGTKLYRGDAERETSIRCRPAAIPLWTLCLLSDCTEIRPQHKDTIIAARSRESTRAFSRAFSWECPWECPRRFFIPAVITAVIFEGGLIACQSCYNYMHKSMAEHLNALAVAALLQYLVSSSYRIIEKTS